MNDEMQIHKNSENANNVNVVELQTITPKYNVLRSILITFGVCFVIVIFFFNILLHPIAIDGISMQPTLNNDYATVTASDKCDIVYYRKSGDYRFGDIVIVNNKAENDTIIKRVIAVGGETITFKTYGEASYVKYDGETQISRMNLSITINNGTESKTLSEDYIKEEMVFYFITGYNKHIYNKYNAYQEMNDSLKETGEYSVTIPENNFFCMGDNRNNSYDSRHYGYFSKQDILGEQVLHVPYGKSIFYAIWHKIFG